MKQLSFALLFLVYGWMAFSQNPLLLKDIQPGATGSSIQQVVKTTNYTFFNAEDEDADPDRGLYRTDGTAAGTIKLNLTYPTYISTKADKLTPFGDKIVFAGDNFAHYGEIWCSDGTQAGTIALERIQPATSARRNVVMDMAVVGNEVLYGVKNNDNHFQLKKTNGTAGSTTVVYDFGVSSSAMSEFALFKTINGILYFDFYDAGVNNDRLWRSDGTTAGTYELFNFGTTKFMASYLMPAGNQFYMIIVEPGLGNMLWKSDGTPGGTSVVKRIGATSGNGTNNYPANIAFGNQLIFGGIDGNGMELWQTDGTETGTNMLADIYPGLAGSNPSNMTLFNNQLYFSAAQDASGSKLFKFDGSAVSLVKDVNIPFTVNGGSSFAISGNQFLFPASNTAGNTELWITDGTTNNTTLAAEIWPGNGGSYPSFITAGNPSIFVANNGISGSELFVFDKTQAATVTQYNSYYVNDIYNGDDLYTTAAGNNANMGTAAAPFATINHAIAIAQPGDTIFVDAGFYAENVIVNKLLTLKGRQAGIAPGSLLNRGAETVLTTSFNDITNANIVEMRAGFSSLDGFTLDGNNPLLSGGVALNGEDVNAGIGIYNQNQLSHNLLITNNIIKNCNRYAVFMLRNTNTETITGLQVNNNSVDNIGNRAIAFFNNVYGDIRNNVIRRSFIGIMIANSSLANSGTQLVADNDISSYNTGLYYASQYGSAGMWNFRTNTISTADYLSWTAPNANNTANLNTGILVNGLQENARLTLEGNAISNTNNGIVTGFVSNTTGLLVTGGTIAAVKNIGLLLNGNTSTNTRIRVQNMLLQDNANAHIVANHTTGTALPLTLSGLSINAGKLGLAMSGNVSLPSNTLSGISFTGQTVDYIALQRTAFQNQVINATTVSFEGLTGAQMTLAQRFAAENKIHHRIDYNNSGLVRIKTGEVYVTPESFWADINPAFGTATFSPEIQRATDAAITGDTVRIAAGTYTNQVNIDKSITIKGEGKTLTHIIKPITVVAPVDFGEPGIIQSIQGIGAVHISDLSVSATVEDYTHCVLLQTGGSVKNCDLSNGNQGIFFRVPSGNTNALVENNHIHEVVIGINAQGNNLSTHVLNNTISMRNGGFSAGIFAGMGYNPLPQLTVTNNLISNSKNYGILANTLTSSYTQNSITGPSGSLIQEVSPNPAIATCNWFGSASAQNIVPRILGNITYSPWLTSGNDTNVALGFQPSTGTCNGTAPTLSFTHNDITCYGAANGSIDITITGGSAPYTFVWTRDQDSLFTASSGNLSSLQPGNYHLFLTDANGSVAHQEVIINEPAQLTASASGSHNSCFGGTNGTASVAPSGGITPYAYLWSNGATSDEITGLAAGTYSVIVTDANGCVANAAFEVTQPAQLITHLTSTSTVCSNSATVTANGGTGNYTYLWSNGATTASINNVPAGTYTVTVTDENDCTRSTTITLNVNEAFNPSAQVSNVTCFGQASGSITITNVNGAAPFQYSIDGTNYVNTPGFTGLSAGTYTVTVVDANGCSGFVTKSITEPSLLELVSNNVSATCFGLGNGSLSITATGGTGAYSYQWTGPNGFSSSQRNISNLYAGDYTVIVTDNNSCTATLTRTVNHYPAINLASTVNHISCKGETNGSISVITTGGTGLGFTYQWNTGQTTSLINNLSAGNYTVTVRDNGSGCVQQQSFTITQPANAISLVTTKTNGTGCNSMGTITATGSGGTLPYEYKLDNGTYQATGSFTGLGAGSYTVWIKDANGCTQSKLVSITDNGSDQYEGNNSKNQAKPITIGDLVNARIALSTDIADWFRFTTTTAGNYMVSLAHPDATFNINVYPATNNAPALTPAFVSAGTKTYALAAGTNYYISITGGLSYTCYELLVNTVTFSRGTAPVTDELKNIQPSVELLSTMAYPNPNQGNFNLKIASPEDGIATVELFSLQGQKLLSKTVPVQKGNNNIISLIQPAKGLLLYRVSIGMHQSNGRLTGL